MKHLWTVLLAIGLTASLSARDTHTTADYTYTIHVGAFVKAQISDFQEIRSYGYLYTEKLNNLQQIYMGDYTTEAAANASLTKVKASGYPGAFITRRSLSIGEVVSVIQIGTTPASQAIDWEKYVKAGSLQVLLSDQTTRIVSGPFTDFELAKTRLKQLKKIGFKDAFLKNVNDVLLHKVTGFETGGSIALRSEIDLSELEGEKPAPLPEAKPELVIKGKKSVKPNTEDAIAPPPAEPIPDSYDVVVFTPKSVKTINKIAVPSIRKKVKRTSVLELQKVLKVEGVYTSSLDGYYGPGTTKGYNQLIKTNPEIKKYQLLQDNGMLELPQAKTSKLQQAINNLPYSATAIEQIKASPEAIADVYEAYALFAANGAQTEVNTLMNKAIKAAFTNNKLKNKPPFDYTVDYDYRDMDQLLLHLTYVQSATGNKTAIPCWLFQEHKREMTQITNRIGADNYRMADCGELLDWPTLQLLEGIALELNPEAAQINDKVYTSNASQKAQLLFAAKAQSLAEYKAIDQWNTALWKGLTTWEQSDRVHEKMMTPLRVTYFKSWALLEDYFMNKGFKPKEARGLSLAVLKTIVAPHLQSYAE